jgi:hypothetical protein
MGSPRVAPEPSAGLELSNLQEASEAGGSESSGRASLCRKARPTCGWAQPHPTRSFGRGWPYLGAAVGILSPVLLLKLRSLPSTQGPCLRPTGPRKVGKEGSRRYDYYTYPHTAPPLPPPPPHSTSNSTSTHPTLVCRSGTARTQHTRTLRKMEVPRRLQPYSAPVCTRHTRVLAPHPPQYDAHPSKPTVAPVPASPPRPSPSPSSSSSPTAPQPQLQPEPHVHPSRHVASPVHVTVQGSLRCTHSSSQP